MAMDVLSALAVVINPIVARLEAGKSLRRDEAVTLLLYQVVTDNKEIRRNTVKLLEDNNKLSVSVSKLSNGVVDLKVAVSELKGRLQ